MASLLEIEAAIKQLPEDDLRQLSDWLQNYVDERWDQQLEADVAAGKLDHLIAQAKAHIAANQVRELNKIFENCDRYL